MAVAASADEAPSTLFEICLDYCVENLYTFCDYDDGRDLYILREGISLPVAICESILVARTDKGLDVDDTFLHVFADAVRTKLKRINLRNSMVTDYGFQYLITHDPVELDISGCTGICRCLSREINKHSKNLLVLIIDDPYVVSLQDDQDFIGVLEAPKLKVLSLHEVEINNRLADLLKDLHQLTYLDLSCSKLVVEEAHFLQDFKHLVSLVLYNVDISDITSTFSIIAEMKTLRALDLGQYEKTPIMYLDPEDNLTYLVQSLPKLQKLDLSGTNLAGFLKPKTLSHRLQKPLADDLETVDEQCAIPGLEGRYLDFLGLLGCAYDACYREDIPARHISGRANDRQILTSVSAYMDKPDLLIKSLNHLFHQFKNSDCQNPLSTLQPILSAMRRHKSDKHIQISGSASLFYIVKSEEKQHFTRKIKRTIIKAILDGMNDHMEETTMMRNGCLTLCHFSIPQDVLFEYERVVTILLKMVAPPNQEEFVQRMGLYLLNSLACQVHGKEKQLVGDLGAIITMLNIIRNRIRTNNCDEVMEISWSTLWNVTDETPINCERFIKGGGMNLFLDCKQKFPDKEDLLRNMMGLLGNVAEVQYLRSQLMHSEYVSVFRSLLNSTSDGIEVSYNACGVLAHMISDGPEAWTTDCPTRDEVLNEMLQAISRWTLNTKRNINYRSFEPILRLLPIYETPQAQHWAVWALCNLTKMYRSKYCPLVEKENGLPLLEALSTDSRPYPEIRQLAQEVIDRCNHYHLDPKYDSSEEADMDSDHEFE